jgi:acyl dehydratase
VAVDERDLDELSVEVVARTENLLNVQRSAAGGVVQLTVDQVTRAGVAGGAVLTLVPATGTGDDVASQPGGLLIEAIDRSRFHAVLDTQDSLASGSLRGSVGDAFPAGFGAVLSQMLADRGAAILLISSDLPELVGQVLGSSDWVTVEQARIEQFAQATGDHQWIHVDPERAAAGPFGATVAHGFLTLSLLPLMGDSAFGVADVRMGINYGLNRVRFPAPVRAGSRLRGHFKLLGYEPLPGGAQLTVEVSMELQGSDKPACVAESVTRRYL